MAHPNLPGKVIARLCPARTLGVLGDGDRIEVCSGNSDSRFLVIAGKRLKNP